MRLSDDKINHLSHVILSDLSHWDKVEFMKEENEIRLAIKEGLEDGLRILDGIEAKVKHSLLSMSRKMVEGSREWDIMFAKSMEQELQKIMPSREL